MADKTNNYEWPIPEYHTREWYASRLATDNAIDAEVKTIDDRVTALEGGGGGGGGYATVLMEPTGFTSPDDVVVTYDSTARTVTLNMQGTCVAYYHGDIVTELVDGWESDPHDESPTSALYLKYNGNGFEWSSTMWTFHEMQIAYICYKSDGTFCFAQRETHGLMQWQVHAELHYTIGTVREAGGILADYVASSTTATDRRPTVTATTLADEDLRTVNAAHTSQDDYTRMLLSGTTGSPNITRGNTEIIQTVGSIPIYNYMTGGSWTAGVISNNTYTSSWLIAVPTTADTVSQQCRYIWMMGQSYGNLTSQTGLEPGTLDFGLFKDVAPEFSVIAQIIVRYTGGNWSITQVRQITGSKASQVLAVQDSGISQFALVANEGKLPRVSDGVFEAPVVGTEYYAHPLCNAKAGGTQCYYQRFAPTGAAASFVLVASGIDKVIEFGGSCWDSVTDTWVAAGSGSTVLWYITSVAGNLQLVLGADLDDAPDLRDVWIVYTKE